MLTVSFFVCVLFVSSSSSIYLHGLYTQDNEHLLAQVKGSLKKTHHLQLAVSGDLRHTMANLALLPPAMGLDGMLGQSDNLIKGTHSCENAVHSNLKQQFSIMTNIYQLYYREFDIIPIHIRNVNMHIQQVCVCVLQDT